MRRYIVSSLALLFIALGVPSNAQTGGAERRVAVAEGAELTVSCALRVDQRAAWRLDGGALPPDVRALPGESRTTQPAALSVSVRAERARPHHAGLYTCSYPPLERIRVTVTPGETTTVASAGVASVEPVMTAAASEGSVLYYEVGRPFALNCNLTGASDASDAYVWKKNGTSLEQVVALVKRYSLEEGGAVLRILGRSTEDDYGNYSCALRDQTLAWELRGLPYAKLQHNANVVEKQPLKIICKMIGKPYPPVSWTFTNETENATDVSVALGERVTLRRSEQGVEGGELVVAEAERSDAGQYTCKPEGGKDATTTLRVKDQFAALWPFLGICAEVFVLCAIILVYEKRRTKPELDDSDTDNHEQKKS